MTKKHILLFNKTSGEFFARVGYEGLANIDDNFFTLRVVEFDDSTHTWDGGNATTGKISLKNEIVPIIVEATLDNRCAEAISDVYKPHHELNAIFGVLSEIIEKENMSSEAVTKFKEIHSFITNRRLLNDRYKLAYMNDPNWVYLTKEQTEEKAMLETDGGLAEKMNSLMQ